MEVPRLFWASDAAARAVVEAHAATVVGAELAKVRYFGISGDVSGNLLEGLFVVPDDEDRLDSEWRHGDYDLLDWGLELETVDGRIFGSIPWVRPAEGLSFTEQRLVFDEGAPVARWDVTDKSRWTELIGKTITAVTLYWEKADRQLFTPHSVVLGFDGMAVVLSDAGDQLLVSFGDEPARRNQVGPYSSRNHRAFHERVARIFRGR